MILREYHNTQRVTSYQVSDSDVRPSVTSRDKRNNTGEGARAGVAGSAQGTWHRIIAFLHSFFVSAFLPQDFPDSVSEDYVPYQIWDTLQAFCSSITGTLATRAVLKGVGVGNAAASASAATITHLLRDGTGMVGRIAFAWYQGTDLDNNAKQWRLVADVLNDLAILLELISPAFGGATFVFVVCLATLARSIVGVAGGATRAALIQHQARRHNMGDVAAKDGSQETLVNLAALLAGLIIVPLTSDSQLAIWSLFFVFTGLHLYANYRAVSCLVMDGINQGRLDIMLDSFIASSRVPPPPDVNRKESVVFGLLATARCGIRLGSTSILTLSKRVPREALARILQLGGTQQGRCFVVPVAKRGTAVVDVLVSRSARTEDILTAYMAAYHLLRDKHYPDTDIWDQLEASQAWATVNVGKFLEAAQWAGWTVGRLQLSMGPFRVE